MFVVELGKRAFYYVLPMQAITVAIVTGIIPTIWILLTRRRDVLFAFDLKGAQEIMFSRTWQFIGPAADRAHAADKHKIVSQAYGVVVELGAGTGITLQYYDASKITHLFALEPNLNLHAALREAAKAAKLEKKLTILPFPAEDYASLAAAGVDEGSVDTVVCVQVLCCVEKPKEVMIAMRRLLKSGGALLYFEHVASDEKWTRRIQSWYQVPWDIVFTGCRLRRESGKWLVEVGGWREKDIPPVNESPYLVMPHAMGKLIKA